MSLPNQSDDWGFRITNEGCGFQIRFASGYILSVQFGAMHYCENRRFDTELMEAMNSPDGSYTHYREKQRTYGMQGSPNAEIAIIDPNGTFIPWEGQEVSGWVTPDKMLIMAMACGLWGMQKNSKEKE